MSEETVRTCGHIVGAGRWSAWLDGEVELAERRAMEAHLATCPACREQARIWLALRSRLTTVAPPDPDQASAAFWQQLAPHLTPRRAPAAADAATVWTPAVLALGALLWQLIGLALGAAAMLAALGRLATTAGFTGGSWVAGLTAAVAAFAPEGPAGMAVALGAGGALTLLAVCYVAWMALWLRPAHQGPHIGGN